METNDLFIHPVLEIYQTTPMAGDPSGLIANMGQKISFAQADGSVEAKKRIKDDFNALLRSLTPQDIQKYNRQLVDYKNRVVQLIRAKSTQAVDPRIDKETIQNQEAGGRPLGFKNWLAGKAAR